MTSRTMTLAVCLVSAAALLAACGSDDKSSPSSSPATTLAPLAAADFNGSDVSFAQGMIPHHQQAVEMAEVTLGSKAQAGAKVVDLATRIKAAQDPEIEQMTGWLVKWGAAMEPATSDAHMNEGTGMSGGDGMMSADEMATMAAASGADFDRMFLEMMTRHHEGAIAMAKQELASGSNSDALGLARKIIAAQQTEIDEMKAILRS